MNGLLRRLASESAIYGLGAAASQVVGIVLMPIYAGELGDANYGVLVVLNTTISLASMVSGFALAQAFFRTYISETSTEAERRHVLGVALSIRLLLSVTAALLIAALAVPLGNALFDRADAATLVLLLSPIVLFDTVNVIPLSLLRAERRPKTYMGIALLRAVLGSVLIVVLVVVAQLGVAGALIGSAVAAAVTTLIGVVVLVRAGKLHLAWDAPMARAMLAFAAPLVPAAAAGWSLGFVDRYLLIGLTSAAAVGVYAVGYTIGQVINVFVVQPFSLMWAATKWDIYREDAQAPRTFARVLTAFTGVAAFVALGVSAAATDVVRLLFDSEFHAAPAVVPFSAFGYVLYGAYVLTGTGLNVTARTRWIGLIFAATAVANVAANLVLIPIFGFMGAAYTTLASYALLASASAVAGQRHYAIPWEVRRLATILGVGLGLSLAAVFGPDHMLWRVACILVYPPVVLLLRAVTLEELRRAFRAPTRAGITATPGSGGSEE